MTDRLIDYETLEVAEDIATSLALRRLRIRLPQRILAGLAGVGEATVQRIEYGKCIPRPQTALALEEALAEEEYRHDRLMHYYNSLFRRE